MIACQTGGNIAIILSNAKKCFLKIKKAGETSKVTTLLPTQSLIEMEKLILAMPTPNRCLNEVVPNPPWEVAKEKKLKRTFAF